MRSRASTGTSSSRASTRWREATPVSFVTGICFEIVGVLVALYGAYRARGLLSFWPVTIMGMAVIGVFLGVIVYSFSVAYPELIVFAFVLAMVGAWGILPPAPMSFHPRRLKNQLSPPASQVARPGSDRLYGPVLQLHGDECSDCGRVAAVAYSFPSHPRCVFAEF